MILLTMCSWAAKMNNDNFVWSFFFPILRLNGIAPFIKSRTKNYSLSYKWLACNLLIILYSFFMTYVCYMNTRKYFKGENNFSKVFVFANVIGYPFSFGLSMFLIFVRRFKFLETTNKINSLHGKIIRVKSESVPSDIAIHGFFVYYLFDTVKAIMFPYIFWKIHGERRFLVLFGLWFMDQGFKSQDVYFAVFIFNLKSIIGRVNLCMIKKRKCFNLISILRKLRIINIKVLDAVELVNDCFSEIALISFALNFTGLVYSVYFLMLNLGGDMKYEISFYWCSFFFFRLVVQSTVCWMITKEVLLKFKSSAMSRL